MDELFENIEKLTGVGKKHAEGYKKLDINTPYDLLSFYPRDYIDFSSPVDICEIDLESEEPICIRAMVEGKETPLYTKRNFVIYSLFAADRTGTLKIVFYNTPYSFQSLVTGLVYLFYGKVKRHGRFIEMAMPKFIPANSDRKIQPVYHLTRGISLNLIRKNVRQVLDISSRINLEWMPQHIIEKNNLLPLNTAIEYIHFPISHEAADKARTRLAFDEGFLLMLGMQEMKYKNAEKKIDKYKIKVDLSEFISSLQFKLTDDQTAAIKTIQSDMEKNIPMNRLLQGDVGSGKTVAAAAACFIAYKNNVQSVLMAPTEILAQQHLETFKKFFEKFDVNLVLLTGSLRAKERREALENIKSGTADIIIGTNAVMQSGVEYNNLGLVITDEQHRFGVNQRKALAEKGGEPHKLVMSATPIPRTLALMLYGELDISAIRQMPSGRLAVKTFAVTGNMRQRAYKFIEKELDSGNQAYIICPLIEKSDGETDDKKSVVEYQEKIVKYFPNKNIGILHGKLSAKAKQETMESFKNGDIDILISTTVVEVGVDCPNATVMMIESAENFGLSQLHQLRGRVGRGNKQSWCILVTDTKNEISRERLKVFCRSNDGFKIAEEDLKQRGAGDFFGDRQHGLPRLKIADLANDIRLFESAKESAEEVLRDDPKLEKAENRKLKIEVIKMYAKVGSGGLN